ncbi:MAG TPA: efflux RND transporter periplasmic adaptor subunit [Myxococcaceae bacterium]|nr:efflux RND transporter periplasmic adaptor subunit [Myxococcaceae bacterium]
MIRSLKVKTVVLVGLGILLTAYVVFQIRGVASDAGAAPTPARTVSALDARIRAEGRLAAYPGAQVVVGTDFAGTLTRLAVKEKDIVRRGDLLAEIRADEQRAQLAEARGRIAEAKADLTLYELDADRLLRLFSSQSVARNALDRAVRDRDGARARLQNATATAHRIEAILDKAQIVSPIDGVVLLRHVQPGETVPVGAQLLTLADLSKVRIEAEVDEFDSASVAIGSEVEIAAEGFPNSWKGRVEEIPDGVGPRKLKPQDPGKPTDTRVLLVKVALSEPTTLKLGQRVEVSLRRPAPPDLAAGR